MGLLGKPVPGPPPNQVEIAQIDANIRYQWQRLTNLTLTDVQAATLRAVIDGLLDRRYRLNPVDHESESETRRLKQAEAARQACAEMEKTL